MRLEYLISTTSNFKREKICILRYINIVWGKKRAEKFERPDEARIEFLATAKSKNFFDIVATKINKTAPQPLKETQTFYVENQIDEKEKYPVGYPREAWLEE